MRNEVKARTEAEQHWIFLEKWLHIVFVDAMLHGWKHGQEGDANERKESQDELDVPMCQ